jgi:hypothetical protein
MDENVIIFRRKKKLYPKLSKPIHDTGKYFIDRAVGECLKKRK